MVAPVHCPVTSSRRMGGARRSHAEEGCAHPDDQIRLTGARWCNIHEETLGGPRLPLKRGSRGRPAEDRFYGWRTAHEGAAGTALESQPHGWRTPAWQLYFHTFQTLHTFRVLRGGKSMRSMVREGH